VAYFGLITANCPKPPPHPNLLPRGERGIILSISIRYKLRGNGPLQAVGERAKIFVMIIPAGYNGLHLIPGEK
jgi:hypothetical protein